MNLRVGKKQDQPLTVARRWTKTAPLAAMLAFAACGGPAPSEDSRQRTTAVDTLCTAPLWQAGVDYHVAQKVRYDGRGYRCLQSHESLSTWSPSIAPALWKDLGSASCQGGTGGGASDPGEPTPDAGAGGCSLARWEPGIPYAAGDEVGYEGAQYQCRQAHNSLSTWTPDATPALWLYVGQDPCASDGGVDAGGSSGSGTGGSSGSGTGGSSGSGTGGSSGAGTGGSSGSGTGGSSGSGATEYAPYFYTWGWGNTSYAFTDLVDLRAKSGVDGVTLAFVLSDGGQCKATRDIHEHAADVQAFLTGGGLVKVSFGGANGTYLENACGSAQELADALRDFVDETGLTDLDFDVEQGGAMNASINAKRSEALRQVQIERGIRVSITLAAMPRDKWDTPGGITAAGLEVVASAVAAQVQVHRVNLMTMDYGPYYSSGQAMGELAKSALIDAHAQLGQLLPGASDAKRWGMLGATPMIGQNDVATEVFTLSDAETLASFAKQKGLGLVSFWAIQRDQPCPYEDLGVCSKANTADFQFHQVLSTVKTN